MYIDNPKKLHDDLLKIMYLPGDLAAANDDGQAYDIDNLISIIEKWIHTNAWTVDSFNFQNETGIDPDEMTTQEQKRELWNYKRKLTLDYNKLKRIYKKIQEELNN